MEDLSLLQKSFILAVVFLGLMNTIGSYVYIWYTKYGTDQHRNLLSRFSEAFSWCAIHYYYFCESIDVIRFVAGPINSNICLYQAWIRNLLLVQASSLLIAVNLTRYIYLFMYKTTSETQNCFWNFFVELWVWLFCILSQTVNILVLGRKGPAYYYCAGEFQLMESKRDVRANPVHAWVTMLAVFVQLFVSLKIIDAKLKIDRTATNETWKDVLKDIFVDMFMIIDIAGAFLLTVVLRQSAQSNDEILTRENATNNISLGLQLGLPPVAYTAFNVIYFYRQPDVGKSFVIEMKNRFFHTE